MTMFERWRKGLIVGPYEWLRPIHTLPTGMTFNATTGMVNGTVLDTSYNPPGNVVTLTDQGSRAANYTALNNALAAAANGAGTRIRLAVGADYGGQYFLPTNSGGWIYVETAAIQNGTFISEGVRATTANIGAMPKLYCTSTNAYVFYAGAGCNKYRFVGLDFTFAPAFSLVDANSAGTNNDNGWINFPGDGASAGDYPSHIIIDRCVVRGATGKKLERGFYLNGANIALIDSSFEHMLRGGSDPDGQCFTVTSGPGPYKINNNHMPIGNRGETFAFGGGNTGIVTADIEIQRNHLEHPVSYHGVYGVKNLGEFKMGKRILLQGNVFNGYKSSDVGQQFYTFVAKTVNQNGYNSATQVRDLTMLHNEFRNCSAGFHFSAQPENWITHGIPMQYIDVINNRQLVPTSDLSSASFQSGSRITIGTGDTGVNAALKDFRILHTSLYAKRQNVSAGGALSDYSSLILFDISHNGSSFNEAIRHTYENNLFVSEAPGIAQMFVGENSFTSSARWNGMKGTTSVWQGNAMARIGSDVAPTGTTTTASVAAASLDASTLALQGGSPFLGVGTSGRDPGPIHALIDSAISGVV